MTSKANLYAGAALDRVALRRKDVEWISRQRHDGAARLVPVWRNHTLVDDREPARPRLAWSRVEESLLAAAGEDVLLLGVDSETIWFALDVSRVDSVSDHPALAGRGRFVELRSVGALLPPDEANLAAYARGLVWWHQRQRYCGVCGHPTDSAEAGHVRICRNSACGIPHFPRTDPAVIMLVVDGEDCLLGRQPRFPPGLYSTLAGFVEPGESLEEAVAREVFEETGVHVATVAYQSSQPWPFPSSLMLGFRAQAVSRTITVHSEELEDAGWFSRDTVRAAARGSTNLHLPRADSISRRLIEEWINEPSG